MQKLIIFLSRLILVLSCAFIFLGTAKAGKVSSVGVADTGKCNKIPYKWSQGCELLKQLRSESYFKVPYDLVSDDLLLEHIKDNKPALIAELAKIDYGRDLQRYLKKQQDTLPNEAVYLNALELLVDVPKPLEYLKHLVEISIELNNVLASSVLSQSFETLNTIIVGIQVYRNAVGIYTRKREMLETYIWDRCGGITSGVCKEGNSKDSVWLGIKETYSTYVERISEDTHIPIKPVDQLGNWFENAFSAYRLVAFDDSNSIRYVEGEAIARSAQPQGSKGKDDIRSIDANAVWTPSEQALMHIMKCSSFLDREVEKKCVVAEMRKLGVTDQAVSFTNLTKGEAYMTHFRELGKVDIAQICQFGYNSPELCEREILVNGLPVMVDPYDYVFDIDIRDRPEYSSLARKFPEVTISTMYGFLVNRSLPKGGQRFIFTFGLVNGCRVCDTAGSALVGFDFDQRGQFIGTKLIGLEEAEVDQVTFQISPLDIAQHWAPSFDCAKATTGTERMICSSKELAEVDVRMVDLYKMARNNSPNKQALTREQNSWRKNVRDACTDSACILKVYEDRIRQLSH